MIEPDFDIGLERVAAHVGTPFGRLAVGWSRAGDAVSIVVDVPYGVEATLVIGDERMPLPPGRSHW